MVSHGFEIDDSKIDVQLKNSTRSYIVVKKIEVDLNVRELQRVLVKR